MIDKEIKEDMVTMFDTTIAVMESISPKLAGLYKGLYDELVSAGFTEEQAMLIITNINLNQGK